MAVTGREGIVEGRDKPGNPVVGYLRPVPGSPSFVVVRMELAEIERAGREHLWLMILLVSALLVGTGTSLGVAWRGQHVRELRDKAQAAEAQRKAEARFRFIFEAAPIGLHWWSSAGGRREDLFNATYSAITSVGAGQATEPGAFARVNIRTISPAERAARPSRPR